MQFAGLQLRNLLATDAERRQPFAAYQRVTLLTTTAGVLACAAVAVALQGRAVRWAVLLPIVAMRAADAFSDIDAGLWQRHERMRTLGVGRLVQLAVSTGGVVIAIVAGAGAPGAALATACGSVALLAYLHRRTATDPEIRSAARAGACTWSWRSLGPLAAEGFPLGVILLLASLQASVPLYFVEHRFGDAAIGLFAAATQLTGSGQILIVAMGAAALPRLASAAAARDGSFSALVRRLVLIGAALGGAGITLSALAGRPILALLYGEAFGAGARILVILSVGATMGFVASVLGYALMAARIIKIQPVIVLVSLAALVVAAVAFIPGMGVAGVAWAMVASSSIHAIASAFLLARRARRPDVPALEARGG
jgi:O-antigen/teichoic acid export membrane protein